MIGLPYIDYWYQNSAKYRALYDTFGRNMYALASKYMFYSFTGKPDKLEILIKGNLDLFKAIVYNWEYYLGRTQLLNDIKKMPLSTKSREEKDVCDWLCEKIACNTQITIIDVKDKHTDNRPFVSYYDFIREGHQPKQRILLDEYYYIKRDIARIKAYLV